MPTNYFKRADFPNFVPSPTRAAGKNSHRGSDDGGRRRQKRRRRRRQLQNPAAAAAAAIASIYVAVMHREQSFPSLLPPVIFHKYQVTQNYFKADCDNDTTVNIFNGIRLMYVHACTSLRWNRHWRTASSERC